jgi:hypothetical protein
VVVREGDRERDPSSERRSEKQGAERAKGERSGRRGRDRALSPINANHERERESHNERGLISP